MQYFKNKTISSDFVMFLYIMEGTTEFVFSLLKKRGEKQQIFEIIKYLKHLRMVQHFSEIYCVHVVTNYAVTLK